MIESLIEKCDVILLGGGMIFTFYKAKGLEIGKSVVRNDVTIYGESVQRLYTIAISRHEKTGRNDHSVTVMTLHVPSVEDISTMEVLFIVVFNVQIDS